MYDKLTYLLAAVLVLGLAGSAVAGNNFTGAGDGSSWDDPANWSAGEPPFDATTHPAPDWINDATWTSDGTTCVIDDTMAAACYALQVGSYGGDNTFIMTGGALDIGPWGFNIGRGGNNNQGHAGSFGHVLLSGGEINAEFTSIPEQWGNSPVIQGELVMEGGTLETDWMRISNSTGVGVGVLELKGGDINVTDCEADIPFEMCSENASMDVAGGTLIVCGDQVAQIQEYINNGWITAHGGIGDFELDYDVRHPGRTTLTALLSSNRAQQPNPGMLATGEHPEVALSWLPSANVQDANGHDVYFGTSYDEVNDADPLSHPNVLYANVDSNSFGPPALDLNRTYYWRVDQINEAHEDKMWRGFVWQFTVAEYLVIDDFVAYGDCPLSGRWRAGGSATLSLDTSDVSSGAQAMRIAYTDAEPAVASSAIASEDWTRYGIQALNLWCRADAGAQALSVVLNNSAEQLVYGIGQTSDWQELQFDLSQFGVDLSNISHIGIQIVPVTGETGAVIIDDIRVYPCRPGGLVGDLNGDCVVNFADFATLSNTWLDAKFWP